METYKARQHCPVCGSTDIFPYKKSTFDYNNLTRDKIKITDNAYGEIWDLSRCETCTFIFADPFPSPQYMQSLYSQIQDPLYDEEAEGRGRNFIRILDYLAKFHPNRGVLFDIGAATGILLALARERGWQPEGIETSSWAVKTARDKYNITLQEGGFETACVADDSFTAVTMVDFIEHIPEPKTALEKAYKMLRKGGTLCLVTPNIKSLAARTAGKKWWHFRPAHLGYFTRKSIVTLLEQAGFNIIKIRSYAWTFSAHYILSRIKGGKFLLKNRQIASFCRKISLKLTLGDSFEIYAQK